MTPVILGMEIRTCLGFIKGMRFYSKLVFPNILNDSKLYFHQQITPRLLCFIQEENTFNFQSNWSVSGNVPNFVNYLPVISTWPVPRYHKIRKILLSLCIITWGWVALICLLTVLGLKNYDNDPILVYLDHILVRFQFNMT